MLQLAQLQLVGFGPVMRLQTDRVGKFYQIIDLWDHCPHERASFTVRGEVHTVEYAFAPPSFLEYLRKGEKFGCYVADMMFLNAELLHHRVHWIPYIVLKLYCERFVDPGLDETGKVQHYQALFGTIRLAGMTMPRRELEDFLSALMEHDDTGYFDLDHEVRNFIGDAGSPREARRRYLERHHGNHWVRLGREEERLPDRFREAGFRNHAEVLYQQMSGRSAHDAYLTAMLVHELVHLESGTPLLVDQSCSRIAYLLTKEMNGLVDLVRFIDHPTEEPGHNIIVRLRGRQSTWEGLSKRLSYGIHRVERQARELLEGKRHEVTGLLEAANVATVRFNTKVLALRQSVPPPHLFEETLANLEALSGNWKEELAGFAKLAASMTQTARELDEAADVLLAVI